MFDDPRVQHALDKITEHRQGILFHLDGLAEEGRTLGELGYEQMNQAEDAKAALAGLIPPEPPPVKPRRVPKTITTVEAVRRVLADGTVRTLHEVATAAAALGATTADKGGMAAACGRHLSYMVKTGYAAVEQTGGNKFAPNARKYGRTVPAPLRVTCVVEVTIDRAS